MNDNAYMVDFLREYNVSTTFDVKDLSPYLENVDDFDLRINQFQPEGDYMHCDSNMEGVDSNAYGHSNGPMTRVHVKQLQNALISQINATEAPMSLKACKMNGNSSNLFVCFQIRLGS